VETDRRAPEWISSSSLGAAELVEPKGAESPCSGRMEVIVAQTQPNPFFV